MSRPTRRRAPRPSCTAIGGGGAMGGEGMWRGRGCGVSGALRERARRARQGTHTRARTRTHEHASAREAAQRTSMTIKMALATASETITEKVRDSFSSSFRSVGGAPMGAGVTRLAGGLQIYGARERNPSGNKTCSSARHHAANPQACNQQNLGFLAKSLFKYESVTKAVITQLM